MVEMRQLNLSILIFWGCMASVVADERVPLPLPGPEVANETTVFYDAADDLPDQTVERGGRLVVPFDLPAGARSVGLPMSRQLWNGFERVKILIDAEFDGDPAIESAIVRVTVRPGTLPRYSWPHIDLPARPVTREGNRLVIEVSAAEIGERAKEKGVIFPCNLDAIRLMRHTGAPAAKGYLATIDLRKEGLCEEFSCDNGKLFIANLDDPAKCRPHFTLVNSGPACTGAMKLRVYDQPTGKTLAEHKVVRPFAAGERFEIELPKPDKAGCYHVDYTFGRKDGYRYSHTISYAAMHPAGKNAELFTDDFKFSSLAHLEFYSMNERRRMMAYMREMGANYTRAGGRYWGSVQPNGPDQPFVGWKRYVKGTDICLANGVERGVSVLLAPKWAKDPAVDVKRLAYFPRYECLEEYVAKFAGGLAGRVRHFEGNNEPNLTDWTPELEGRYERMLYKALKKVRPDAIFHSGEWGGFSGTWDDAFYEKHNPNDYDIWAQHYHNSIYDTMPTVAHVEQLRHKLGITKPWWGDECANCNTNQHAQAVDMFCKNIYSRGHGAIGMTWYNLRCKGSQKPLPPGETSFGMLTWDLCPRGVYVAFNAYAKTFRKSVLKGSADVFPGVMSWRYEAKGENEGEALYPLWSMNRRYRTMTLAVPTNAKSVETIDLYGNVCALPVTGGKVTFSTSADPVTIRLKPATATLGQGELITAEEYPNFNRGVATKERPASFRANTLEQYAKLFESSGENDDLVWRNTEDLSGHLFVFWSGGPDLHIRVCVDDDVHHPTAKGEKMYTGDGFQLMMLVPGQSGTWEIGGAWHDERSADCDVWVWGAPEGIDRMQAMKEIRISASRNEKSRLKTIWYEIRIPYKFLGTNAAGLHKSGLMLNAMLNDNDGRCREGFMSFAQGNPKDPTNFILVDFRE